MSTEKNLQKIINSKKWYHGFEILPGIFTPGKSKQDSKSILDSFQIQEDLHGLDALDVGTWDGPMALELAKRGANVVASDIQDPDLTCFNTMKKITKKKISYIQSSIYTLPEKTDQLFDIITYQGVFYHLKNPSLGFDSVSKLLKDNGTVIIEGEVLKIYAEDINGNPVSSQEAQSIAESQVPLIEFCPGSFKGMSNWSIPNFAALKVMIQGAGLRIDEYRFFGREQTQVENHQRIFIRAKKVAYPMTEHGLFQG